MADKFPIEILHTPSEGERMAEAVLLAHRHFPDKHWLFGKGRVRADEPLYGFRVFEPGNEDRHIAEGEHDDPVECVLLAVDAGRLRGKLNG